MGLWDDMKSDATIRAEDKNSINNKEHGGELAEVTAPPLPSETTPYALSTLISFLQRKAEWTNEPHFDMTPEERLERAAAEGDWKETVGESSHPTGVLIMPAGHSGKGIVVTRDGIHEVPETIVGRGVMISILFECENGGGLIKSFRFHKGNTYVSERIIKEDGPINTIWRD